MKRVAVAVAFLVVLATNGVAHADNHQFTFSRYTNTNSWLQWQWDTAPTVMNVKLWRAGSGTTTNACEVNKGWLPAGTYDLKGHWNNYNGSAIYGLAWQVSDKRCSSGVLRSQLFIHSEMKPDGTQGTSEPQRWDGTSDYYSLGCIKLSPTDIANMHYYFVYKGGSSQHGSYWMPAILVVE